MSAFSNWNCDRLVFSLRTTKLRCWFENERLLFFLIFLQTFLFLVRRIFLLVLIREIIALIVFSLRTAKLMCWFENKRVFFFCNFSTNYSISAGETIESFFQSGFVSRSRIAQLLHNKMFSSFSSVYSCLDPVRRKCFLTTFFSMLLMCAWEVKITCLQQLFGQSLPFSSVFSSTGGSVQFQAKSDSCCWWFFWKWRKWQLFKSRSEKC